MARAKKEPTAASSTEEHETIPVQEFLRTRDSVVTGLTTLQNSIGDLLRAYMTHCNTILGGGSSNSLNISNFLNNHAAEADVKKPRAKRAKKERDPNAPKRPLTAYFLYSHHAREVIRGDLTKNNNGEEPKSQDIQDEATRRWNAMEPHQKKEWQDIYNKNYETYKTEVAEYNRVKAIATMAVAEGDAVAAASPSATTEAEEEDEDVEAAAEPEIEESEDEEEEAAPPPKAPSPPRASTPPKETKTPRATKTRKNTKANGVAPTPAPAAPPAATSPTPVDRPFETRVPLPTETSRSSLIAPSSDAASAVKATNGRKKRKEPSPEQAPKASSPVAEESSQPKKKRAKKSKAGEELPTEIEAAASPAPIETPAVKAADKKDKKKKRKSEATIIA